MINPYKYGDKLFNLIDDPEQTNELIDDKLNLKLTKRLIQLMKENDAPDEQYERLGLDPNKELTVMDRKKRRELVEEKGKIPKLASFNYSKSVKNQIYGLLNITEESEREGVLSNFKKHLEKNFKNEINKEDSFAFKEDYLRDFDLEVFSYFIRLTGRTY